MYLKPYLQGNEYHFPVYYKNTPTRFSGSDYIGVSSLDNSLNHISAFRCKSAVIFDRSQSVIELMRISIEILKFISKLPGDPRLNFLNLVGSRGTIYSTPELPKNTSVYRYFVNLNSIENYYNENCRYILKNIPDLNIKNSILTFLTDEFLISRGEKPSGKFHIGVRGGSTKKRSYFQHWLEMGCLNRRAFLYSQDNFYHILSIINERKLSCLKGNILSTRLAKNISSHQKNSISSPKVFFLSNIMDYLDAPYQITKLLNNLNFLISSDIQTRIVHCYCFWPKVYYFNHSFKFWRFIVENSIKNGIPPNKIWAEYVNTKKIRFYFHMWSDEFQQIQKKSSFSNSSF